VGLTAAQVGLGLTIAGIVTFVLAVPLGRLADQVRPRRDGLPALGDRLVVAAVGAHPPRGPPSGTSRPMPLPGLLESSGGNPR